MLMLLWRGWHVRDDCTHGKGNESIRQSTLFLQKYEEDLVLANTESYTTDSGKSVCPLSNHMMSSIIHSSPKWYGLARDVVKINSDASFLLDSGQCWAGAAARTHSGQVVVQVSKKIGVAGSVEEAEARAAQAGLKALAVQYRGPIVLEVDCLVLANDLKKRSQTFPLLWSSARHWGYLDRVRIFRRRPCGKTLQ
ncbi:hypothetical protein ZWY2020_034935 [Hordeum vulgare]|nr:hypothetical protein ZWY2020_034935 [Hordeum vulgare]